MGIIKAGVCVFLQSLGNQKQHLYVILTDPSGEPPTVAAVSLSTALNADKTTVLIAGDHSFVKQETFVVYAWITILNANKLAAILKADMSKKHRHNCSPELLERIRSGVQRSDFTRPEIIDYCKDKF